MTKPEYCPLLKFIGLAAALFLWGCGGAERNLEPQSDDQSLDAFGKEYGEITGDTIWFPVGTPPVVAMSELEREFARRNVEISQHRRASLQRLAKRAAVEGLPFQAMLPEPKPESEVGNIMLRDSQLWQMGRNWWVASPYSRGIISSSNLSPTVQRCVRHLDLVYNLGPKHIPQGDFELLFDETTSIQKELDGSELFELLGHLQFVRERLQADRMASPLFDGYIIEIHPAPGVAEKWLNASRDESANSPRHRIQLLSQAIHLWKFDLYGADSPAEFAVPLAVSQIERARIAVSLEPGPGWSAIVGILENCYSEIALSPVRAETSKFIVDWVDLVLNTVFDTSQSPKGSYPIRRGQVLTHEVDKLLSFAAEVARREYASRMDSLSSFAGLWPKYLAADIALQRAFYGRIPWQKAIQESMELNRELEPHLVNYPNWRGDCRRLLAFAQLARTPLQGASAEVMLNFEKARAAYAQGGDPEREALIRQMLLQMPWWSESVDWGNADQVGGQGDSARDAGKFDVAIVLWQESAELYSLTRSYISAGLEFEKISHFARRLEQAPPEYLWTRSLGAMRDARDQYALGGSMEHLARIERRIADHHLSGNNPNQNLALARASYRRAAANFGSLELHSEEAASLFEYARVLCIQARSTQDWSQAKAIFTKVSSLYSFVGNVEGSELSKAMSTLCQLSSDPNHISLQSMNEFESGFECVTKTGDSILVDMFENLMNTSELKRIRCLQEGVQAATDGNLSELENIVRQLSLINE